KAEYEKKYINWELIKIESTRLYTKLLTSMVHTLTNQPDLYIGKALYSQEWRDYADGPMSKVRLPDVGGMRFHVTHHYKLSYSDRIIEEFRDMPRTLLQEFIKGIQLTIASFCALELAKLALFPPISPELRAIWQMVGRGPRSESSIASLPRKIKKIPNRSVQISNTISIQAALLDSPHTAPILLWEFLRRLKTAGLDQDTREMSFEEFIRLPNNQVLLQPIIVGQAVTYTLMNVAPKPRNPIWGRTKDVRGILKRFNVGLKISPLQISTLLGTSLQDSAKYNITPVPIHNLPLKEVIRLCRPENQHYLVIQNTLSYAQQRKYTFRPWTADRFTRMIRQEHVFFSFFPDFVRSPHEFYRSCKQLTKMIRSEGESLWKGGDSCHDFFQRPNVREIFGLPENKGFSIEVYDRANNTLVLSPDLKKWKVQQLYDAIQTQQYLIHIIDPYLGSLPEYEWTKEYIRIGIFTMRSSFGKLFRPSKVKIHENKIKWIKNEVEDLEQWKINSESWKPINFPDIKSKLPNNISNMNNSQYDEIQKYFMGPKKSIKDESHRQILKTMHDKMKRYQKSRSRSHSHPYTGFSPAEFVQNSFKLFMDQVQIRLTKKLSGYVCLVNAPMHPGGKIKELSLDEKIKLGKDIMECIFVTWKQVALEFRSFVYLILDQFIKSIDSKNINYYFDFIQSIVTSFPRFIFLLKKQSLNYPVKLFLGNINTASNLVLISKNGVVQFSGGELGHIRDALLSEKKEKGKTIKWYEKQLKELEKTFSFIDKRNGYLKFTDNVSNLRDQINSCLPEFEKIVKKAKKVNPLGKPSDSKISFEFMHNLTEYGSKNAWYNLAGYEIEKSPTVNDPQFAGFPSEKIDDGFSLKDKIFLNNLGKSGQAQWLPNFFQGITDLPVDAAFLSRLPRVNANREGINLCLRTMVATSKEFLIKINTSFKTGLKLPDADVPFQYFMLKSLKKIITPIEGALTKFSSLKSSTSNIVTDYEDLIDFSTKSSKTLAKLIPLANLDSKTLKNLKVLAKAYPKSKFPYSINQVDLQEGMHLALRHLIGKTSRMLSLTYKDDYLNLGSDIRNLIEERLQDILSAINLIKMRKNYHLYPKLSPSEINDLIDSKNYKLVINKNIAYLEKLNKKKKKDEIVKLSKYLAQIKKKSLVPKKIEINKIFNDVLDFRIDSPYSDSEDSKIEWNKIDLRTYSFETLVSRFFEPLEELGKDPKFKSSSPLKLTEWYESFKDLRQSKDQFNANKFQAKENVDKAKIIANKCSHYISFLRKWNLLLKDLNKNSPSSSFPVISTSLLRRWENYFVDPFSASQKKIKNFVYSKIKPTGDLAEFSVLKEIEVDANNSIPYKRDENISIDPEFPPKDQKDYLPLLKLLTHRVCTIEPIDAKRVKITSVNGDKSFKDWLNSVSEPLEVVEENFKAHNNYFKHVKSILSKNRDVKSTIMVGEASLIQTFENLKAYFLDPKRDKERKKGDKWKDKDDKGDDLDETNTMVGDEDEDSVEVGDPDSEITSSPIEISINLPKIRKLLKPLPNSKNFIPFLVYARQICFQGKKKLEPFPSPTPQFRASIGNRSFYGQSEIGRFNTAYIFGHYQPIPSSEKNLFQLQALYYVLKINPPKGDSFLLTTRLDRPSRSFPLFEDIDTMFRSMDEDRFNEKSEKSEFVIGYHQTGNNDSIPPELMQNRVQTLQDHMFRLFGVSTYQELFGEES
ncbi:MAG: hypothetical protein ACTSYI_00655, partial [Promethearchaeota archaeon]